ncbi:immunoglobulin superfamily member 1-like isoform X2 [Chrysemys picta bellii]|uniref:immunoglobulin superfamily member 1-like isoform X2 n=1 Tax=Chrysemys picta bellii TaxID=8478 RepID=UPI0032B12B8B
MASALIVLLLRREYPKPTISESPSRVVALGGNVTIRCEGRQRSMEFFLRKAGHPNLQVRTVPDGTVAEFPIPSVSREDGGSYTCDYRSITQQNRSSYPSDPIEIIVGEPSYPKPSIYLSSCGRVSLGGAVSVWCRGQRLGVRFVLNKDGHHFPPVDSDDNEAVFAIRNVRWEHGGSYSCSYHSRSEPFAVSYPSNPVELVVRGPPAPLCLISNIITGVSTAAVLLLLLLLVAFVCFIKTRARKGAALRPSSPMGVLKAPAQEDPIYDSIDEGEQPQTLEPGIYAELDRQTLQPSVYDVINVSRGAPQ